MDRNSLNEKSIVAGCNYHTTWQSNPKMRFVLKSVVGNKATLITRTTGKTIVTDVNSLIFIMTEHNKSKAIKMYNDNKNNI